MTFPDELRFAAAACYDADMRAKLLVMAASVEDYASYLTKHPSRECMKSLNGVWAAAERVLKDARTNPNIAA